MDPEENTYCHYSDLPSPMAYMLIEENSIEQKDAEEGEKQIHPDDTKSNLLIKSS